ncbi:hypothetical protein L204_101795 [Cryptococcus depauperatus]
MIHPQRLSFPHRIRLFPTKRFTSCLLPCSRFASTSTSVVQRQQASFYISNVLPIAFGRWDFRPQLAALFEEDLLDRLHTIASKLRDHGFRVESWEVSRKDGGVFLHFSYVPPLSGGEGEGEELDQEKAARISIEPADTNFGYRWTQNLSGKLFIPQLEASAQTHGGWPSWLGTKWAKRFDERHVPGHTLYSASGDSNTNGAKEEEAGILRKGSEEDVKGLRAAAGGGRVWVVKGRQWTEDMNRFPSNKLRVEFDGPDVSQEMLYTLFRPYGKLSDIQPPTPVPSGSLRYAIVSYSSLTPAVIAINVLHGYSTATNTSDFNLRLSQDLKITKSRLRIYYERPIKAHAVRDWISGHPKLVLPVIAFLIGTLSYTFFDPIRAFFVRSKLEGVWDMDRYSLVKAIRAQFTSSSSHTQSPLSDPSPTDSSTLTDTNGGQDAVGKSAWKDRMDSERTLLQNLKEWPSTFIVVSGPSGSGKESLVQRVRSEVKKPTMVIDCEEIAKSKNDAALISALAEQTGYYPIFSFMSSLSSLIDLASLGLIGQKAGFSTPTDQSLRQILDVVSSALKSTSIKAHKRHEGKLKREREMAEIKLEKRQREEMVNRGWKDGRLDCVAGNGLSELGGGIEPWVENDWDISGDAAVLSPSAIVAMNSDGSVSSSEDIVDAESESLKSLPIVVLSSFAQKSARGDLYNVLAEWATSLVENKVAHVIVVTEGPTAGKVLTRAMPSKPLSVVGLSDANEENALNFVHEKLHLHPSSSSSQDTKTGLRATTLSASDSVQISKLGGRMVDLENLVSKVRLGSSINDAVNEIILRNVIELRKAAFGDDSEDAKGLPWSRAQAWKIVSELAKNAEIPYAKLLQEFPFKNTEHSLKALEEHELVSVSYIDGRASMVRPGKPVFKYAFEALVNDPIFKASCQIEYNSAVISKAEAEIKAYEAELQSLKDITIAGGSDVLGVSSSWIGIGGNNSIKERGKLLLDKMGALICSPQMPSPQFTRTNSSPATTLAHVLKLIQSNYREPVRAFRNLKRKEVVTQSHFSILNAVRSEQRRYSSNAAQYIETEAHERQKLHTTPRPIKEHRRIQSELSDKQFTPTHILSTYDQFIKPVYPAPISHMLPNDIYQKLRYGGYDSAKDFLQDFEAEHCEPIKLGSISNLVRVFELYRRTAHNQEWIWLERQLRSLMRIVCDDIDQGQKSLPLLVSAIRAYALIEMSWAKKDIEEVIAEGREKTKTNATHSLAHAISALVYLRIEEWERARTEIRAAVARVFARIAHRTYGQVIAYPSFDLSYLKQYESTVVSAGRNEDLVELLRSAPFNFRQTLLSMFKDSHFLSSSVANIFFRALGRIDKPIERFIEEWQRCPTTRSGWFGSLLFLALANDRSKLDEALELHKTLSDRDVVVAPHVAIYLCKQFAMAARPEARRLYHQIRKKYPKLPRETWHQVMLFAARFKWIEEEKEAWEALSSKAEPYLKDQLALAKVHAYNGRVTQTISALDERFRGNWRENADALVVLFTAHIYANDTIGAEALLDQINCISPLIYPYNALLQLYADQANVGPAIDLFDRLLDSSLSPDLYSYTALISLFAKRRDPINANSVFEAMMEAGIKPDSIAYAAVINAEVEAGNWTEAAVRWSKLPARMKHQQAILSTILKALVWLSSPTAEIVSLFRKIESPSSNSWALVIQSACDNGDMDLARDLYSEMDNLSKISMAPTPDMYHFSILLHGYLRLNDGPSARAVYEEMQRRNIVPSSVTYGIIIQTFTRARGSRSLMQAHDFAMTVYDQVQTGQLADLRAQRSLTQQNIFSPLVIAHGELQNWEEAKNYFDLATANSECFGEGGPARKIQFWSLLMDVYRRASNVQGVEELWERCLNLAKQDVGYKFEGRALAVGDEEETDVSMKKQSIRTSDALLCIPLSIVLDTLSSTSDPTALRRIRQVWSQVHTAGFGFDAANYNHLAMALARAGDVEGGFRVAEMVLMRRFGRYKWRHDVALREQKAMGKMNGDSISDETELEADVSAWDEEQADKMEPINSHKVAPVFGPPNRRHQDRFSSPFPSPSKPSSPGWNPKDNTIAMTLLRRWRPSDTLWRPTILTITVLDHAFAQLESAGTSRTWIPFASDDFESEDKPSLSEELNIVDDERHQSKERGVYGILLPLFGNIPVRHFVRRREQ